MNTKAAWVVCAWFTPDYALYAERFRQSLIEHGAPHDLIEVEKPKGAGWEKITRLKPSIMTNFIEKHPGKTIVLSDVDALCRGELAPLADLECDVAFKFGLKRLRGRYMLTPRSTVVVVKPTELAHRLIVNWTQTSANASFGDTDESSLTHALGKTPGLRIASLEGIADELLTHYSASMRNESVKASHLKRAAAWFAAGVGGMHSKLDRHIRRAKAAEI